MSEPLFVFIALAGSAILGFVFSLSISRWRTARLVAEVSALNLAIREKESSLDRLKSEADTRLMAINNLQKITQDVENQTLEKNEELKMLRLENSRLQEEIQFLTDNPLERIREIDVIREVPVLIIKEIQVPESRMEKAKKLMKAFTKGYLDENGHLQSALEGDLGHEK
jgi:hypothetical protein